MDVEKFKEKVKEAAESDKYMLRDESNGILYWVDTTDENGIYYHTDEGSTHRCTWEQAVDWFELILTEDNKYKIN